LRPTEIALFSNADETELLATIFTTSAKKLHFEEFAQALHQQVPALKGAELAIEGPAGQQPRTVAQWGATSLTYRAAGFDYRVDQGAFFQVNRWLIDALVENVTANQSGALAWDLFAGVGLFARQLTQSFARVVAVESSPSATQALAANLKGTASAPVRASTLDFLRRNRKPEPPDAARPDLIVLDPPRTGLGEETTSLLNAVHAPAMVYVSCDPATLARDLHALTGERYKIDSITLVDMFPQTFHIETVVRLSRT
jgi:23S rRNA (uracil1939-C5)-methyltransferase